MEPGPPPPRPEQPPQPKLTLEGIREIAASIVELHSASWEEIEKKPHLVRFVLNGIEDLKGALKEPRLFESALNLLNICAEDISSPETHAASIKVITDALPLLDEKVSQWGAKEYCFKATSLVLRFGDPEERWSAMDFLTCHLDLLLSDLKTTKRTAAMPYINLIVQHGPAKAKQQSLDTIHETLRERPEDHRWIGSCLYPSFSKEITTLGLEAIEPFFHDLGLNGKKMLAAWQKSTKTDMDSWITAFTNNKIAIDILENKHPGSAKVLYQEFGIMDFGRYPDELLCSQYEDRDRTNLPYGVIFYPRNDWNGAFYQNRDTFSKLFNKLSHQRDERVALRIFEGEGKLDIAKALGRCARRYGKNHKISFAILGGHGTTDSIQFGGSDDAHTLKISDLQDPRADRASFFEEGATIILVSCSTGFQDGIGQRISKRFKVKIIRVLAPDKAANLKGIDVQKENGRLIFSVEYESGASTNVYQAGEKEERFGNKEST